MTATTQVDFYHVSATPLSRVVAQIAEKVIAGGARLLIVSHDAEQRRALDRALWTDTSDSFLPHAEAGGDDDDGQPVLLASTVDPANGARTVALIDGQWRDEVLTFERILHLFDDEAIVAARAAWRTLAERDGVERRYWKQTDAGRWEQAA